MKENGNDSHENDILKKEHDNYYYYGYKDNTTHFCESDGAIIGIVLLIIGIIFLLV